MKPKILLMGRNGQVGAELERLLTDLSDLLAIGRRELDLSRPESVRRAIRDFRPHIIVNAAAYTAVDRAESDETTARAINADAPRVMAEEAKKLGAALVHYSTDYVFDGLKCNPYTEDDPPNPINVYGKTKLVGEQEIENVAGQYVIFRTAWVYSTQGKNFLLTILRLSTEREELRVVADQIGAPTWSREIALATTKIVTEEWKRCEGASPFSKCSGIYHMTAGGQSNWWEFAKSILEEVRHAPHDAGWLTAATRGLPVIVKRISAIETSDYPTPARRPAYSVLSNSRLKQSFDVHLPDWGAQLHAAITKSDVP